MPVESVARLTTPIGMHGAMNDSMKGTELVLTDAGCVTAPSGRHRAKPSNWFLSQRGRMATAAKTRVWMLSGAWVAHMRRRLRRQPCFRAQAHPPGAAIALQRDGNMREIRAWIEADDQPGRGPRSVQQNRHVDRREHWHTHQDNDLHHGRECRCRLSGAPNRLRPSMPTMPDTTSTAMDRRHSGR